MTSGALLVHLSVSYQRNARVAPGPFSALGSAWSGWVFRGPGVAGPKCSFHYVYSNQLNSYVEPALPHWDGDLSLVTVKFAHSH